MRKFESILSYNKSELYQQHLHQGKISEAKVSESKKVVMKDDEKTGEKSSG